MKVKLLRKWRMMMDFLFIGDFVSQMSLTQKIRWAWSCVFNRELRRLAYQAYKEFNKYHCEFHWLGYTNGIGVMAWALSRNGIKMHEDRKNVWDAFAHKYRRHSKKWNSPEAKLKRIINGEDDE